MTTYGLSPLGNEEYHNSLGQPAVGWQLQFYVSAVLTATKKDRLGAGTNELTLVLNSRGEAAYDVFLDTSKTYTVKVLDADSALITEIVGITAIYEAPDLVALEARVAALEAAPVPEAWPVWTDTGVANAVIIEPDPVFTSYDDGMTIRFRAVATSSGATTIDVNGLGAKSIKTQWNDPVRGADPYLYEILAGAIYTLVYESAGGVFRKQDSVEGSNRQINFHRPTASSKVGDSPVVNIYRESNFACNATGWVNHGLYVQSNANNTGTGGNKYPYDWTATFVMNNETTADSEQCALYAQGNILKTNSCSTWAGCFELTDKSGGTNPTHGQVGVEISNTATGTDTSALRWGLHVAGGSYTGAATQLGIGISVDTGTAASWHTNFRASGTNHYAAIHTATTGGIYTWYDTASTNVGAYLNGTYSTKHAIRLRDNTTRIGLEPTGTFEIAYNNTGWPDHYAMIKTSPTDLYAGLSVYTHGLAMMMVNMGGQRNALYPYLMSGTGGVGLNTTQLEANVLTYAVKMRKEQKICFEDTQYINMWYEDIGTPPKVHIGNGTTGSWNLFAVTTLNEPNTQLYVGDYPVVTCRQRGFSGGWTGTQDLTSTFTISSATAAQIASRVAAIETALKTHGLIGVV